MISMLSIRMMLTNRAEWQLVAMSTLLELGANIEHRVAAWHRVPHLHIITITDYDEEGEDDTPSVATRMNSQPGWSLYCSICGTGEITWQQIFQFFISQEIFSIACDMCLCLLTLWIYSWWWCNLPASTVACSAPLSAKSHQSSCRQHSKVIWAGKVNNILILWTQKLCRGRNGLWSGWRIIHYNIHVVSPTFDWIARQNGEKYLIPSKMAKLKFIMLRLNLPAMR